MHERLKRWGVWSRIGLGLPAISSVFILGSPVPAAPMSDDEGLLIDAAVYRLRQRDEEMAECVRLYYLKGLADYQIAETWRCERKRVGRIRWAAVAWIDGSLDSVERKQC